MCVNTYINFEMILQMPQNKLTVRNLLAIQLDKRHSTLF